MSADREFQTVCAGLMVPRGHEMDLWNGHIVNDVRRPIETKLLLFSALYICHVLSVIYNVPIEKSGGAL